MSTLQFDQSQLGYNADVVVIGAGLAGLVATRRLTAEGVNVLILEARDRSGGRMNGGTFNGESYDLGAQWVAPQATAVRTLVHELGLPLTNQYHEGESAIGLRSRTTRFSRRAPLFAPHVSLDYHRAIRLLNTIARKLDATTDTSLERAKRIDTRSFAAWLLDTCRSRTTISLLTVLTRIHFHAEPTEISLYYVIDQVSAHRGAQQLFRLTPAMCQERVIGGSARIAERLGQQLRQQLICDTPILALRQDEQSVTAYSRGTSFRAHYAIITTPPVVTQQIYFEPHLPPARDALQQRVIMGRALTVILFYDYPFWRENGKSGFVLDDAGPFSLCHDVSPVNSSEGALACAITAESAHHWGMQPRSERLTAVTQQLQRWFGNEALAYRGMIERDWNAERWNRGSNGFLVPGAATYIHNVATPVGRVHWAGSETATHWTNTLEGAVESGERAAAEVVVELGSSGLLRKKQ